MLVRLLGPAARQKKSKVKQPDPYQPTVDMDLLPLELWFIILKKLTVKDLMVFNLVSKFSRDKTGSLWASMLDSREAASSEQDNSYQHTFFKKFKGEGHSFIVVRSLCYTDQSFNPIDFINDHANRISSDIYPSLSDAQRAVSLRRAIPHANIKMGPLFILELNVQKNEAVALAKELNQDTLRSHIVKIHSVQSGDRPSEVTLIYQKEGKLEELATIAATPKLN